jgi:DNA mismatch repair protein MutS
MTEYLHNTAAIQPRTLFATHYHELTELEELLPRVKNYSVAVRKEGDNVMFLHRLVPGGCDHSYGIEVARLAGMPRELIARAREVLRRLEANDLTPAGEKTQASVVREPAVANGQMNLFERPPEDPVLTELRGLDVGSTTPLEALVILDRWKMEIEDRKTRC